MAHLHNLETWRHPLTKQRAVIAPIYGTNQSVAVDVYEYRNRYGVNYGMFPGADDARRQLRNLGFQLKALKG